MQRLVKLYTIIIVTKRINMNFSKIIKDITFIPFVIKDTWTTIRDLSINQFRANQHAAKSMREILDSVEKFTKNQNNFNITMEKKLSYVEATSTSLGKWHDWQEEFNGALLATIISEKKLIALLQENFESIDVNISEQDIQCSGEEVASNISSTIDDLTTQINDLSNTINEVKTIIQNLENKLYPQNKNEEMTNVV